MRLGVAAALVIASLPVRAEAAVLAGLPTNGPGPYGGVFPVDGAPVQLASEEVTIRVERDATHHQVEARYRIGGAAQAAKVTFGVALNGTDDDKLAGTIRFALDGGTEVGCHLAPAGAPEDDPVSPAAWCTAALVVPPGEGHLLVVRYRGELEYQGRAICRDPHLIERQLAFPLSSAGRWKGPPARVRVTLDVSRVPGSEVTARPPPTSPSTPPASGSSLASSFSWTFAPDAPDRARELDISLVLRWPLHAGDFIKWGCGAFAADTWASSVLEPATEFAASNVSDANPLTAWCPRSRGDGWVEVQMPPPGPGTICGVNGVGVMPGWAAQPGHRADRRPGKIRLSTCGGVEAIAEMKLPSKPRDASNEVLFFEIPQGKQWKLNSCFRLTVSPAGCLSEVLPIVSCATPL